MRALMPAAGRRQTPYHKRAPTSRVCTAGDSRVSFLVSEEFRMRTTSPRHSGPGVPAEDVADTTKTRRSFIFFGALAGLGALAPRSLRAQRPKRRVLPPRGDPREA